MSKARLDTLLVEHGLATSRDQARRLIMAGEVLVDDQPAVKPGTRVPSDARLRLRRTPPRFVSRGGEKLAGALDAFGLDVRGMRALDVGASTGGFTDCLLQRGARRVIAVDVGYGQLAWSLQQDERVDVRDRVNARALPPDFLDEPADLATIDVSFISLTLVLPAVVPQLVAGGVVVPMVKPQFEVGPERVGAGGVVRDPAVRRDAIVRVRQCVEDLGLTVQAEAESVLAGAKGNREVFLCCRLSSEC